MRKDLIELSQISQLSDIRICELKTLIDGDWNKRLEEKASKVEYTIEYEKYLPISIICPTRDRCHGIYHFLNSAYRTAWSCDNFEVIFICDDDDKASPAWIDICKSKFPKMNISYHIRKRTEFLNRDYFNWGVQFAKGKYFWVCGDDLEFIQSEWDKCIFDTLDAYFGRDFDTFKQPRDDKIVYINVKDDTPKPPGINYDFSCFPIMSREAVESVGFLMIPEIPSWCSDYPIGQLYSNTNRIMNMNNQIFKHLGVETGSIVGDELTHRLDKIMRKYNSKMLAKEWLEEKLPICENKIIESIGGEEKIGEHRR